MTPHPITAASDAVGNEPEPREGPPPPAPISAVPASPRQEGQPADGELAEMAHRLASLERRCEHLETALHRLEEQAPARPRRRAAEEESRAGEPVVGPTRHWRPAAGRPRFTPVEEVGEPSAEDIPFVLPVEPAVPAAPREGRSLEQTVGLKWAAWVGAIVLIIGVGPGIKFAYDQGWLGQVAPALRLSLMAAAGVALLAAGEWVYRRVHVIPAAGLFGAGVAVFFLVSYAGHVYYAVYDYKTAFLFAAVTTLVGSAVAVRGRLVTVAVLAQVGGALAPFILGAGRVPGTSFFTYLLMLQVVALALSLWGNSSRWWAVRGLSLATTSFWMFAALLARGNPLGWADEALWFALLYAVGYQAELVCSGWRGDRARPSTAADTGWEKAVRGWGTVFSTLVTAGATAVVLHILSGETGAVRGGCLLGLAGAAAAAGLLLEIATGWRLRALATGYLVQAAGLLLLAVPVALSGVWVCLAWAVLGLALATLGSLFDRGVARIAGWDTWWPDWRR